MVEGRDDMLGAIFEFSQEIINYHALFSTTLTFCATAWILSSPSSFIFLNRQNFVACFTVEAYPSVLSQ